MISVSNLKKSFGDLVVLDGITETIEKGGCGLFYWILYFKIQCKK